MKSRSLVSVLTFSFGTAMFLQAAALGAEDRLAILFLGDDGHHRPAVMHDLVAHELAGAGIDLTYTADIQSLTPDKLSHYDGMVIFRDSGDLPAEN